MGILDSLAPINGMQVAIVAMPLCVLTLIAMMGVALASVFGGRAAMTVRWTVVGGTSAAMVLSWWIWPSLIPAMLAGVAFDRLGLSTIMILLLATLAAVATRTLASRVPASVRTGYDALMILAAASMAWLASAADLVTLLIALESMAVCLYALTAIAHDRPASVEAALKFFVTGAFATGFLCLGIAFIFGATGSTNLTTIAERAALAAAADSRNILHFGMAMLLAGLAFKVAAVPFHAWAPDVYDGAPTATAQFLASAVKVAALIVLLRVGLALALPGGAMWHHLTAGLAAVTMLWGSFAAVHQSSLKRLLAYSSIAQAGTMLMTLPSLALIPTTMSRALLLYALAYALATTGAFAVVAVLGQHRAEVVELRDLSGLARTRPLLAIALAIFFLSLTGIPPLLGFFAKFQLLSAVVASNDLLLAGIGIFSMLISVYYYVRPIVIMAERVPRATAQQAFAIPLATAIVIALAAVALILFGIVPANLLAFVNATVY